MTKDSNEEVKFRNPTKEPVAAPTYKSSGIPTSEPSYSLLPTNNPTSGIPTSEPSYSLLPTNNPTNVANNNWLPIFNSAIAGLSFLITISVFCKTFCKICYRKCCRSQTAEVEDEVTPTAFTTAVKAIANQANKNSKAIIALLEENVRNNKGIDETKKQAADIESPSNGDDRNDNIPPFITSNKNDLGIDNLSDLTVTPDQSVSSKNNPQKQSLFYSFRNFVSNNFFGRKNSTIIEDLEKGGEIEFINKTEIASNDDYKTDLGTSSISIQKKEPNSKLSAKEYDAFKAEEENNRRAASSSIISRNNGSNQTRVNNYTSIGNPSFLSQEALSDSKINLSPETSSTPEIKSPSADASQSLLSVPGTSPSSILAIMNNSPQVYQQLSKSDSDSQQKRTGQGRG